MRNRVAACESVFVVAFHRAANVAAVIIGRRCRAGRGGLQCVFADGLRGVAVCASRVDRSVFVARRVASCADFVLAACHSTGRFGVNRPLPVVAKRFAICKGVAIVLFHCTANRATIVIGCRHCAGGDGFQRISFYRFCGVPVRNRVAVLERMAVILFHRAADRAAVIVACRRRAGGGGLQCVFADGLRGVAVFTGWVDRGVCRPRFPAGFTDLMHHSARTTGWLDVSNPLPGMAGGIAARKRIRVIRSNDAAIGAGVVINRGFRAGRSRFQGCGTRCFFGECVINLQRATSRTDASFLSMHRFQRFPCRVCAIDKRFRVLCHGRCIKTSICAVHRCYKNGAVNLSQTVETIGFPSHDCRRRRISKRVVAGHRIVDTHFIRRQIEDLAADRGHLRLHWIRYPSNYFAAINVKKVGNTSVSRTLP